MPRPAYTLTACVLLRRGDRWLLTVRSPDVDDAAGTLGLVGGHVEDPAAATGVLEDTARREAYEETGVDLSQVPLLYLESEYYRTDAGVGQVCVTFVAPAPATAQPRAVDAHELTEVGWWTPDEVRADPRGPSWLPGVLERAAQRLGPPQGAGDLGSALSRRR